MKTPTCLPTSSDGSNSIPQVLPRSDKISIENGLSTPFLSQIKWRCRRGTLELDTWLIRYMDNAFEPASLQEQRLFSSLLDLPDPELSAYLSGQQITTDLKMAELINKIRML